MNDGVTQSSTDTSAILKELSDIKANLAVNSSETVNIKTTISEIKVDLREIKSNFVTQTQHKVLVDALADHENRIRANETFDDTLTGKMWGIGVLVSFVVGIATIIIGHYWK